MMNLGPQFLPLGKASPLFPLPFPLHPPHNLTHTVFDVIWFGPSHADTRWLPTWLFTPHHTESLPLPLLLSLSPSIPLPHHILLELFSWPVDDLENNRRRLIDEMRWVIKPWYPIPTHSHSFTCSYSATAMYKLVDRVELGRKTRDLSQTKRVRRVRGPPSTPSPSFSSSVGLCWSLYHTLY